MARRAFLVPQFFQMADPNLEGLESIVNEA